MNKLIKPKNNFTIISNEVILNNNLSCKAKAVYCYLQLRPDDWEFYTEEIVKNFKEKRDCIIAAIKELEANHYIKRYSKRINGKFANFDYYIFNSLKEYQEFIDDNDLVKTESVKTELAKTDTTNTYSLTNTDLTKIDLKRKETNKEVFETENSENEVSENEVFENENSKNENSENKKINGVDHENFKNLAMGLKTLVENKKNITISTSKLNNWIKEIERLHKSLINRDKPIEDMKIAIQFLLDHMGEEYVPIVESGKSFRDKFLKIEDAIKRKNKNNFMRVDVDKLGWFENDK